VEDLKVFIMNLEDKNIELRNAEYDLEQVNDKLSALSYEISLLFKIGEKVPNNTIKESSKIFCLDFTTIADRRTISFDFSQAKKEIRIKPNLEIQYYNSAMEIQESKKYMESFSNILNQINNTVYDFDETLMHEYFKTIKDDIKIKNNLVKQIEIIKNDIIKIEKSKEFNVLELVIPKIKEFCINSFLCDKYGITYEGTPDRKNVKVLKETIMKNLIDKTTEFLIYEQNAEIICFQALTLTECKETGDVTINHNYKNNKSKKFINNILAEQFKYDNKFISKEDMIRNSLFEQSKVNQHSNWNSYGNSINYCLEKLNKNFAPIALKKNLASF
jgi:hypothetical protein